MPRKDAHKWQFKARFRRGAFGWRSQPAILRVRQAVSEIKSVSRKDPLLAAEGAVTFLERVSPALQNVDGSSGAIGTAVNKAIAALVPIISEAPADPETRAGWLDRLFEAHAADDIPYIEVLAEHWGDLCASKEIASAWADRLVGITGMALSPRKDLHGYFHGTPACLSALFRAERYAELIDLVTRGKVIWSDKRWVVKAVAAQGRNEEAIKYAESCRDPWASDRDIDRLCEESLLSMGHVEEAYARYGLRANRAGTYLATFRAVARKYPHRSAAEILSDLVDMTPGEEGKWFAAAKDAGLFTEALALAGRTPCDPRTLTRAARDHAEKEPVFALESGLLALRWLAEGYGYEITAADVWGAYVHTLKAAEVLGKAPEVKARIRKMVGERPDFIGGVLGRELGWTDS